MRRVFIGAAALMMLLLSVAPGVAGGNSDAARGVAGGNSDAARAEHQRIIEFWTPERVAQAVPRDFVFDPGTGRFSPSKKPPDTPGGGPGGGGPGGGGGGGGGGDTAVITGSSWKNGGDIDGASGKVLFAMGGSYFVCSATTITDIENIDEDRSLILTAAHCVFDESAVAFAENWMFIPDYDAAPEPLTTSGSFCDGTEHGCWTASAMVVHNGYATADGFNDTAVQYDFGIVVTGLGGKDDTMLETEVSPQETSFLEEVATNTAGWAFGYPAQKKWKGNDLIYCSGPIDTDPLNNGDTYRLNECKLNGGSSGGPWLAPFTSGSGTVISVNSYRYTGINAMHGPILNGDTQAVYDEALNVGLVPNVTVHVTVP